MTVPPDWSKMRGDNEFILLFYRTGFEEERIEALLHKLEIQMKHQSTNFGLSLASVSSHVICDLHFVSMTTRTLVCVFCLLVKDVNTSVVI